ncbi:ubiquitin-protein ligase (E3) [Gnomoniopsis smithogilvyi]|uniref:HECT-type E3 ubiquitin transferase n=1 Tax=Gnomoniopsis smithogilvyi TaxID=1191159 RepID=A0A9W9CXG7_9PEZI|nr:ubiquitin-protein ligase (E3) [Gnomoniopsis smithogilvyi]
MSFPTFSGSSRRPRNVNMSGQKNLNPFAATAWTPSASSTASKTVAGAQAERRQRQLERDKLKAAENIQRTWRGHRVRRNLRDKRREEMDSLYTDDILRSNIELRSSLALPLAITALDSSRPDDQERLSRFAMDLEASGGTILKTANNTQINKLARQLLAVPSPSNRQVPRSIFVTLVTIFEARFDAVQNCLDRLYTVVGAYCQNGDVKDAESLGLLERAILAPITRDSGTWASKSFALCFLTQPKLELFESNVFAFAKNFNVEKVASAIVEAYTTGWGFSQPVDARLWLLAHFIALGNGKRDVSLGSSYLNAIYLQLSSLLPTLKKHHIGQGPTTTTDTSDEPHQRLPPFIEKAVESLVARDEISHILERFTTNFSGSSQEEHTEASFLAAYILTLIRCFPALSDDIRMKLYMADNPSNVGQQNSVKFFWNAMVHTRIFSIIQSDQQGNTLALLQRKHFKQLGTIEDHVVWDREWRAIFLFLELYVFVLRLADDEDFASPWASVSDLDNGSTSRLRQCMLNLSELKGLTLFLRNLAFTLYYNANDLQNHAAKTSERAHPSVTSVDDLFSPSVQTRKKPPETYNVISGLDFDTFRNTISTAMRMVYERDSRRQFLPRDHWLMTSRFDMTNFMDAVVSELEHQREVDEEEDDEDDVNEDEDSSNIQAAGSYAAHLRIEQLKRTRAVEQRKRLLASVGPKLEILRNMPFIIPFDVRVKLFRKFVLLDKIRRREGAIDADQWRMLLVTRYTVGTNRGRGLERLSRHTATVSRGKVFQDAFDQLYDLNEALKEPLQIKFVDQFGMQEAGIDGGGVLKEFLTSITKEAFTDDLSLFVANSHNTLYPNPSALDQRQHQLREAGLEPSSDEWRKSISDLLAQYEFLGRIIGKCLYEGILIDIVFASFFLLKWAAAASDAGYRANINDLREFDEELYNGMMRLKNYSGDVSELGLDYTIEDQVSLPGRPTRIITRNLIDSGSNTTVTNENKLLYINYVARHRLDAQPGRVTKAFLKGLGTIIEPTWLSMFNQSELQRLVGGDSSEIDIEDLRRNTAYSGVYEIGDDGREHPTIEMFWEVMHGLEDAQRRDVLKYVTSTPRAPLLGFSQLRPLFSIRDSGSDASRLPSASTCVNLLKLPIYKDAAVLKEKLLYAVSSGAGFDLS